MFQENGVHTVNFPQSLQSIEIYAFLRNNISQLTLPPNLTHIGQAAFYGNKIAEVSFPNHFQARTAHPNAFERNGPNSTSKRIPESTGTWILQDDQWVRP